MKVIGLWGRGSIGKTGSLKKVADKLRNMGAIISVEEEEADDKRYLICYQNYKICITTPGDIDKQITKNIDFCKEYDGKNTDSKKNDCEEDAPVDIFITATRSKGSTCAKLNEYAKEKGTDVEWVAGYPCDEKELRDAVSDLIVKIILQKISRHISSKLSFK